MRVVVIADTHLRLDWPNRRLPAPAVEVLATAEVILHAGDVTQAQHLDELRGHAPVRAVLGNNDPELAATLPETLEVELAGVRVGMVHDSGPARGRERRRQPHRTIGVLELEAGRVRDARIEVVDEGRT